MGMISYTRVWKTTPCPIFSSQPRMQRCREVLLDEKVANELVNTMVKLPGLILWTQGIKTLSLLLIMLQNCEGNLQWLMNMLRSCMNNTPGNPATKAEQNSQS